MSAIKSLTELNLCFLVESMISDYEPLYISSLNADLSLMLKRGLTRWVTVTRPIRGGSKIGTIFCTP